MYYYENKLKKKKHQPDKCTVFLFHSLGKVRADKLNRSVLFGTGTTVLPAPTWVQGKERLSMRTP